MDIILRDSWRTGPADLIEFNEDGTVPFSLIGTDVCLPEDYKTFITEVGTITCLAEDNFCLTHYEGSVEIVMLQYLIKMSSINNLTGDLASGVYHGKPKMLPNYIPFGAGLCENFFLNVDRPSPDFGKVFTSIHTQDPWGEGQNVKGLGWVADSFSEFMNNLQSEESLRMCDSFKAGISMDPESFSDWYFTNVIKIKLPEFEQDLGERCCKTLTRNGILYAVHFGINRADLQAEFVTLMWKLAPNFFMTQEFSEILNSTTLNQEQKIEAICSLPEEVYKAASANDELDYWYPELIRNNILGIPYEG